VNPFPTSVVVLVGFLLAPLIAGLLASILSCLSILRLQKPPWSHALLCIVLGIFSSLLAVFGGDVFHPSSWPGRIPEQWDSLVMALVASIPLSIAVALVVVALFQARFKKHLSREERQLLRRLRRRTFWLRARWFNLLASSALIVCLTGFLMYLCAGPVPSGDKDVSDDPGAAHYWNPAKPPAPPPQPKAVPARPLIDLSPAAAALSPFCILGLLASGGWLAFTLAYWRGYYKVRPRHRRHFPASHRSPANVR
jgi:hypothetical protein